MGSSFTIGIFILIFLIGLQFLTSIHSIVTPFLLAAILAYFLNPAISFLTKQLKLPRLLLITAIFISVIVLLIVVSTHVTALLAQETSELSSEVNGFNTLVTEQLTVLPDWMQPSIRDAFLNLNLGNLFTPRRLWPYFSGALSGVGSLFIFLLATFYFLKDGHTYAAWIVERLPLVHQRKGKVMLMRTQEIFNSYLRGQLFLVLLMSTVSWLVLFTLKVKYSLLLGLFTGVAEIVPIIGPLTAGAIAVVVAMFDGVNTLAFPPIVQGAVVAGIFFLLRQMEDIFVIPYVLGKTTKLHPLVVLFAVLVGGHVWGVFGMILAVPVAALLRMTMEYVA